MTTFVNRNAASYYRPQQYTAPQQAAPPRPVPDIRWRHGLVTVTCSQSTIYYAVYEHHTKSAVT